MFFVSKSNEAMLWIFASMMQQNRYQVDPSHPGTCLLWCQVEAQRQNKWCVKHIVVLAAKGWKKTTAETEPEHHEEGTIVAFCAISVKSLQDWQATKMQNSKKLFKRFGWNVGAAEEQIPKSFLVRKKLIFFLLLFLMSLITFENLLFPRMVLNIKSLRATVFILCNRCILLLPTLISRI